MPSARKTWVPCLLELQQQEEEEGNPFSRQVQEVGEVILSRVVGPRVPEVVEAVLLGPGVSKEEEEVVVKEVVVEAKGGM